jgi:ABC-type branched-subunit amino acid transport system permease subunit
MKLPVAALLAVYIVVPLLLGANNYVMSLIVAALVIGGIALAWALLGNLGGMVSFGHSASSAWAPMFRAAHRQAGHAGAGGPCWAALVRFCRTW